MPVAKLKASNYPELMKSEEGNDPVDTIIRQAIGKEPLLSFSRAGDRQVQWIQLLQQGACKFHLVKRLTTPYKEGGHSLECILFDLHPLFLAELSGWPFSSQKVQMQKCDKCSREFCSPINYRRHIRVHHRLRKLDKVSLLS
jgi:hypothetical protein